MQPEIARCARKRQREDLAALDNRESPVSKKRKHTDDRSRCCFKPSIYDTLSKVHLTQAALEEFDRRVSLTERDSESRTAKPPARTLRPRKSRDSTQPARIGRPDLTFLRGVIASRTA